MTSKIASHCPGIEEAPESSSIWINDFPMHPLKSKDENLANKYQETLHLADQLSAGIEQPHPHLVGLVTQCRPLPDWTVSPGVNSFAPDSADSVN